MGATSHLLFEDKILQTGTPTFPCLSFIVFIVDKNDK